MGSGKQKAETTFFKFVVSAFDTPCLWFCINHTKPAPTGQLDIRAGVPSHCSIFLKRVRFMGTSGSFAEVLTFHVKFGTVAEVANVELVAIAIIINERNRAFGYIIF